MAAVARVGRSRVPHVARMEGGGERDAPLATHHRVLLELQRTAGNAAVAGLVAERRSVADLLAADPEIAPRRSSAEAEAAVAEREPAPVARAAGHVHTGPDAAALADGLGAEAVTWAGNVYFGTDRYRPGTEAGDRLIRHELAHVTRHAPHMAHLKPVTRRLDFLTIKKIPIGIHKELLGRMLGRVNELKGLGRRLRPPEGQGDGGHWWVEIGVRTAAQYQALESYGWWPRDLGRSDAKPLKVWEVLKLKKIAGELNQGQIDDPHHGEDAPVSYHPAVTVDDAEPYESVRLSYEGKVRRFARSFEGSWNWRFNWGKNCHTFIDRLEADIGARADNSAPMLEDPHARPAVAALLMDERGIVKDLASLRGLGADRSRLERELVRLRDTTRGLTDTYFTEAVATASDGDQQRILDLVGCDAATFNAALASVHGADIGTVIRV